MEQQQTWQERVEKLEKQKKGINAGDVINAAISAAFNGWCFHTLLDAAKQFSISDKQKTQIANDLFNAKNDHDFLDKLNEYFYTPKALDKAKAIIESVASKTDFFEIVTVENIPPLEVSEGLEGVGFVFNKNKAEMLDKLKKLLNETPKGMLSVVHNIDENFPGGIAGLAITLGVVAGVTNVIASKVQANQLINQEIKLEQDSAMINSQEKTYSEMVRLREAIENTQATEQGAKR